MKVLVKISVTYFRLRLHQRLPHARDGLLLVVELRLLRRGVGLFLSQDHRRRVEFLYRHEAGAGL